TWAALVVEADLVGHGVVAEDDRQLLALLLNLPGSIQQLGVTHVSAAIPANLPMERAGEDLFVGRDPLDPVPGEKRNHRLADGSFAGPHSSRALAKVLEVALDRASDVDLGILGIAVAVL